MTIKIAHLCEHAFNGGALASLKQIRIGIDEGRPSWKQDVLVAVKDDSKLKQTPSHFEQDAIYVKYEELNRFLKSYNIVIIHKLMNSNIGRMLNYIPRASCKSIVVSHTFSVNPSNCLVGRPDLCICVSNFMQKTFQKLNPKTRFTTIHNAVSSKWIKSKIDPSWGVRPGIVGRANALNAIKYSKKFTEWFCGRKFSRPLIMEYLGGGSLIEEARSHANACKNYNSIDFKGNIENIHDRFAKMASWEFFLYDINMPEGTSMAVLESIALGVPVICSNKTGNNEIVKNGINGYLFSDLDNAGLIIDELLTSENLDKLRSSCLSYSDSNADFIKMSDSYIKAIESLFSNQNDNFKNKNILGNSNMANKEQNTGENKKNHDFISRGNRKVAFPSSSNFNDKNSGLNKVKPETGKEKKVVKVKPETDKEKKLVVAKKREKPSHRPMASQSFIDDIIDKLNQADKISTGPKFTIISAGYNKGKYLQDWFNSLLMQSYRPLEVVFVDDASDDGTELIMSSFVDKLKSNNIEAKYIKNEIQKGCAKSYKIALTEATGEYFGVLDADDALMPNAVNIVMAKYLSNNKISFIWSQYIRCNNDLTMVGSGISRQVPQRPPRTMLEFESHTRRVHCYSHWRTMKKMENMYDVFDCPYSSSVDKFMGYMLEELGHGHFLNLPLYKYRGSVGDGLTATSSQRNNWEKIRSDAKRRRIRSRKKIYSIIL